MTAAPVLTDLADTLSDLASIEPATAGTADGGIRNDRPRWNRLCAAVRDRFAPLNHHTPPADDGVGSLVTVAPQSDPEVKLALTRERDGTTLVEASFANPTDGSWEPLYDGPLDDYDEVRDERTRNHVVYVTDALERANHLRDATVLTPRQAQVVALAERDHSTERIAEILELDPRTVRDSLEQVGERVDAARATVELLDPEDTTLSRV